MTRPYFRLVCRPAPASLRAVPAAVFALVSGATLALWPSHSQGADNDAALAEQLRALVQRVQQLELRNQQLERRIDELNARPGATAAPTAPRPAGAQWGDGREAAVQKPQEAPAPVLDENSADADDGPQFGASLVTVLQRVNRHGSADNESQSRLNYRGDVSVELPAGYMGDARGTAIGLLRFGQGTGVALRPTYTATANSTAFESKGGSDETYAIVAQAFYRLDIPLDNGRFNDQPGNRVELNVGKIDLFGMFDQNAVAGDEAAQFLNNAFVHNPLLDSGGDIGADDYGFAPGLHVGYFNEGDTLGWGVSAGMFASGDGAHFNGSLGRPLYITQVEVAPRQINGEARGAYRLYAWTNGRTTDFDGNEQRHTGFGLSADQRVGRDWDLFGRYGHRTSGSGPFDRALTFGFEHGGRAWGRGHDAVGVAYGLLQTSDAWRRLTAADNTVAGHAASGRERIFEVFYRYRVNDHLELTPDIQLIQRAGGDGDASDAAVFGLRGTLGF